jgi:nicotinate dehydrogenase subunit B
MIANALPQSLIDNPLLSQWIAFVEKGRVRVGSGKVEIGQGILTALTQIAAEELDVRPEQVNLVSGQTDISPAEGFTSGSYSIAVGGASIRLVCAEVRALFLERAAEALNCPVNELSIEDGKILRAGQDTGRDYWTMAGEVALDRRASGAAPVKRPASYRIVGRNLPRLDLPAKVKGAAFIHDIMPDNVLHARVLRQPWRGAHLAGLEEAAVRKAARAPIDILREGEFVAFTADSEIAVMRAAEAARNLARWEGGTPLPDDVGMPAWLKAQPAKSRTVDTGRPGRATQGRKAEAGYSRPFLTYGSIGPACALAEFKDGKLSVWSHCQGPAVLRDWLARALGLSAAQVTVFHRQGAGAYGHNTADDAAFDASFIAMRSPGRTVRVQWPREDEFGAAPISTAMAIRLSAVLDDDGKPADWGIEIWSPPHAQRPGMNGNSNLLGAAALPNAPPLKPLGDVPDERGGGATRNAVAIYDLPRHRCQICGRAGWWRRPRGSAAGSSRASFPKAAPAASALPATRISPLSPPWWRRSRSMSKFV